MVLKRLNLRLNGQVGSKKHKFSRKLKKLIGGMTPLCAELDKSDLLLLSTLFATSPCILISQSSHSRWLGLWCFTPFSTIFQLLVYRGDQFYWWRKPEYPEKTPFYRKSLANFITYFSIEYISSDRDSNSQR